MAGVERLERPAETKPANHAGDNALNLVALTGHPKAAEKNTEASAASARNSAEMVPGVTKDFHVNVNGEQRDVAVHLPKDWDGKSQLPVLYYFNGMRPDGKPEPESFTGLSERADKMGFAVAYMRGDKDNKETYNNGQAVFNNGKDENAYLNTVHEALAGRIPLDESRQGLAGFSEGGSEVYDLAAKNKWVASVQSVEGYMTGKEQPINHAVSEQNIHALHDAIVPENGTDQVCAQSDREAQRVLDSMSAGSEGYIDIKGLYHSVVCAVEKSGNYIEPQRYTVDTYKKADGITGNGVVIKNADMTTYDFHNPITGAEVRQTTLNEGTHGWAGSTNHKDDMHFLNIGVPNEKLSASDKIAEFLMTHRRIEQ